VTAPPLDPTGADRRVRLVFCSMPDGPSALALADAVVRRKLAACAQVAPMQSTYWWRGRVVKAAEQGLWMKTTPKRLGALFTYLAKNHPYEVPDIHEIHVPRVHEPYVSWLQDAIDPQSREGPPVVRRRAGRPAPAGNARPRTRAPRRRR
jgi:periplasmic divalent cation tolerance protein